MKTLGHYCRLVAFLLTAAVLIGLLSLAHPTGASALVLDIFSAAAFAAAFRVHVGARPKPLEIAATVVFAIPLAVVAIEAAHGEVLIGAFVAVGASSLLVLLVQALRSSAQNRRENLELLAAAAVLPLFVVVARSALNLTSLHVNTFDGTAFHIDATLGGQPSFFLGRVFKQWGPLALACGLVYHLTPLAVGLVHVAEQKASRIPSSRILDAIVLAGICGYVIYHVCPVCGPIYRFGTAFPFVIPNLADVELVSPVPRAFRNGIPSLHTAWAILLYWHGKRCDRDTGIFMGLWLVMTELATLGLGEHYVIDLVIAVPFAVAVEAAVAGLSRPIWRREQWVALLVGVGFTALWLGLIRWAPSVLTSSLAINWTLVLATISVPILVHMRAGYGGEFVGGLDGGASLAQHAGSTEDCL